MFFGRNRKTDSAYRKTAKKIPKIDRPLISIERKGFSLADFSINCMMPHLMLTIRVVNSSGCAL
jgi:hypothetical protein